MRTRNVYLGIRPTFEGRYAAEGTETEFDIVAVDAAGKQVARPGIEYRVERTDGSTSGTRSTAAGAGIRSPTTG